MGGVFQICPPDPTHGESSLRHVGSCGQTSVPSEGVSPAWLGARFCTPVPTGLWLMENLEYPVQSIPQGSFSLATRRWGHDRAGEMREDRLNRWRWRAGAAPFDRPHWGSRTNVVGGIKSLAATRSSAVDDHGSVRMRGRQAQDLLVVLFRDAGWGPCLRIGKSVHATVAQTAGKIGAQ